MNDETKNDIDHVEESVEVVKEQQVVKSKSKKREKGAKGSRFAG